MNTRLVISCLALFSSLATFAGNEGGGGGDASELRVNQIRSDIMAWIEKGGARELNLPSEISYGQYVDEMSKILKPNEVVIGFTTEKVFVQRIEKTCKGYFGQTTSAPHIVCNISRFKDTSDSDQYVLIHHEYAGLVNLERNDGASSDYSISTQLSEFLAEQKVLRLAIKKKEYLTEASNFDCSAFVEKNLLVLRFVKELSGAKTYQELLATYADSLQVQIMIDSNDVRISHQEAVKKGELIIEVRKCANSLGIRTFE
jgi:hypothetical protein